MSIADQLNRLDEIKQAISGALISKGQTVTDDDSFYSYASKISSIETSTASILSSGFTGRVDKAVFSLHGISEDGITLEKNAVLGNVSISILPGEYTVSSMVESGFSLNITPSAFTIDEQETVVLSGNCRQPTTPMLLVQNAGTIDANGVYLLVSGAHLGYNSKYVKSNDTDYWIENNYDEGENQWRIYHYWYAEGERMITRLYHSYINSQYPVDLIVDGGDGPAPDVAANPPWNDIKVNGAGTSGANGVYHLFNPGATGDDRIWTNGICYISKSTSTNQWNISTLDVRQPNPAGSYYYVIAGSQDNPWEGIWACVDGVEPVPTVIHIV